MKFSFDWLQSFFEEKLPEPKDLAQILTMHSFEVKEIEKMGKDFCLNIEVLPNRPDCYCHFGIAREISAILGLKMKKEVLKLKEGKKDIKDFLKLKVKAGCQRYSGRIIFNPKISESPDFIKKRLEVCGIKPINNIVDITNYVMLEIGQPLHAFDYEKIEGKKIIVRKAKKGEKILTLDDEVFELDKEILVIADSKKPIAIAGIKGGKETGISEKTKILFLESANFEKEIIAQGSRKIDLRTDASLRFEHGLDPNLTLKALNLAAFLILKICGGEISKGILDFYPQKFLPKEMIFDPEFTNSLLGEKIPEKKQIQILKNLGFEVKKVEKKFKVKVPTFRLDISIPEDLVEEIGRIYGYEKIKPSFPKAILSLPKRNEEIFWENFVKDNLKNLGFTETSNYSFISLNLAKKFEFPLKNLVEVENPVSLEFQFLRPSLIFGLLKNIQKNQPNFKEIKIFEFGKVFKKEAQKISEKKMIAGAIFGDFLEIKGILDTLLSKMGITDFWFDFFKPTPDETPAVWHLKRSAEIKIGDLEIGFLGEISQKVLEELKIEKKISAFEIDFEKLAKLATEEIEFRPISPYPAILRDISVLVPTNVLVDDVLEEIERAGGKILEDVDLIDYFEEFEEGKKSLTFRLVFRKLDKPLEKKEVESAFQKIVENLEKKWQVRK